MSLSTESVKTIDTLVSDSAANIPGTTVVVVSKDGTELYSKSAGKRGLASSEDMTTDNVYWIASCTKMVAGLCCMQQVEKGTLKLDDGDHLENLLPEFKSLQVLGKDGKLSPRNKQITLRMLLTHTSGFGYTCFNEHLRDYGYPAGIDEFSCDWYDIKQSPLTFQPGEGWQYGTSIDWAGLALERATGQKLNDYMQEHIFKPLGLNNMNMLPTDEMKKKIAFVHQRDASGKLSQRDHLYRRAITATTPEEKAAIFHSGGAGLFANPGEYCRIISTLLNNGTCPKTGVKLLEKATVDEMFTNQIPQFPNFGRQGTAPGKPELSNVLGDMYPQEGNPPQGWGITFMINDGPTGRSKATGWWAGIANLFWWADREKGVGGMVCSQILPFGDAHVMNLWGQVEAAVYQGLQ